ncbi:hypothetical protein HUG10_01750 [Halorarum halophilum]|uniref:DUF7513 domain-containing protein n=1 Tax=Halorarum halophilum TaxID=2743090 RepID=A0A7D5KKR6_9EURY|nr:hypothetical protein [Halobaculum halophilum]QLG26342.1 hypothetical protein HUG10_01750 [Halobaculum halophilum]
MSRLSAFLEGWSFRTNKPTYSAGEEITAFVTGYENGAGIVRIGDTIIRLDAVTPDLVDTKIRLRIEEFDENDHVGTATLLEELGGGAF